MPRDIIGCEEAKARYTVVCMHERMPNGELRFRLIDEGKNTAYILTKAEDSTGWQQSHFHKGLLETYIVQEGWMVLAELLDGKPRFTKYGRNELFTTRPHIIHNVYLPKQSVIHTIKHDKAPEGADIGDRYINEDTKRLDGLTTGLSESEVLSAAHSRSTTFPVYSEAYRHFDTLIWQVPAVAVAFSVGLFLTIEPLLTLGATEHPLGYEGNQLAAFVLLLSSVFNVLLSYTMQRFRYHQILSTSHARDAWRHWINPQVLMQMYVNLTVFCFLGLSVKTFGYWSNSVPAGFLPVFSISAAALLSVVQVYLLPRPNKVNVGSMRHSGDDESSLS